MRFVCKLLLIFILFVFGVNAKGRVPTAIVMKADEIYYDAKEDRVTAVGNIHIKMDNLILSGKMIHYDIKKNVLFVEDNVKIVDEKSQTIYGKRAVFKDKLKRGIIKEFIAKFDENSILVARLTKRVEANKFILEKSVFTPCDMSCSNKPIWQLNAIHTKLDYEKQKITYKHLFFGIYGIPVIYFPYFSHPTPLANAQSGLLIPKIKRDVLVIPFYFRVKSNLDFTLSPRLSKNYTILEGEYRHRVKFGQYKIQASYGNFIFRKFDKNQSKKNFWPGQFHIFAKGDFSANNVNYGFDIKRTSDKAYLTNYQGIYDSYLTSKIYANTIECRNYFLLEGFNFQDLRSNGIKFKTPFILPSISTKHIFELNNNKSVLLNVKNNTIVYKEPKGRELFRTALDLELESNLISQQGHMFTFAAANRSDLHVVAFTDKKISKKKNKVWYRNIPEIKARWRYPLIRNVSSKFTVKVEPTAMVAIAQKYKKHFQKFDLIDSPINELSENNIFSSNRFSAIDFYEYGNRFSYGINSSLLSQHLYLDTFLGQFVYKNNIKNSSNFEYVGNVSVNVADGFEFFYRFRKNQHLNPIRNEFGASVFTDKFLTNVTYTALHRLSKYFIKKGFELEGNRVSQISFDMNFRLIDNLLIGATSKLDITSRPVKTLVRSIRVTYLYDCASINGAITDNFLSDNLRGIKKARSKTFSIGLKVINM